MSTAVTLIPKPATKHLWQLPTCTDNREVYPPALSFSMLPVSVWSLIWKSSGALSRSVQPKPLCSFVSDPAWFSGGVDCLCANDFKDLQSSLETLQLPSEATILCCRAWTIPPALLVTKSKSSQGRDKWVLLIPWDSPKGRHRPVHQQPKHICLKRSKKPKVWAWAFFFYHAASA